MMCLRRKQGASSRLAGTNTQQATCALSSTAAGGKCLANDGWNVTLANCSGSTTQQFIMQPQYNRIVLASDTNKCLDVEGSINGDNLIVYPCHGGTNQQFKFVGNTLQVANRCVQVNPTTGDVFVAATCNGSANQLFTPTCPGVSCTPTQVANSDKAAAGSITGTTGQTVNVTCDAGYTGSGGAVCQGNGNGSGIITGTFITVPTCQANNCTPTQVANSDKAAAGSITGTTGQTVNVTCDAGYSGSGNAVCGSDGAFTVPTCQANYCTPTQVANSNLAAAGSIIGTTGQTVNVTCDAGYTGGGNALCGVNGLFTVPACQANPCTPTHVANSDMAAAGSIIGTTGQAVYVTCDTGYVGSGNAICGVDGKFTVPYCQVAPVDITISVTTQDFPEQLGWSLLQGSVTLLNVPVGTYSGKPAGSVDTKTVGLLPGQQYTIEMADSYGDGWNGGIIKVMMGDTILEFARMEYGYSQTLTFNVPV